MASDNSRNATYLAVLGFFLSNVLGGGLSYLASSKLASQSAVIAREAAERAEALALVKEVATSFGDREYAFGDIIRALASGGPDTVVQSYVNQSDELTRKYRGSTELLAEQLCVYFGPEYRLAYAQHVSRFSNLAQNLQDAGRDRVERQRRARAIVDSFPDAHAEGTALLEKLAQAVRANRLHPDSAGRPCH